MTDKTNTHGVFVVGTILNVQRKSGISKAGNAYTMLNYMVLCGDKIVNVQQTDAETAPVHANGDNVSINIQPSYRDNGVILICGNVVKI